MSDAVLNLNDSIDTDPWRPLRLYALFRALLALILYVLIFFLPERFPLVPQGSDLARLAVIAYGVLAVLHLISLQRRWLPLLWQVHTQALVDVAVVVLLLFWRVNTGIELGFLLVVSVAAGSLLGAQREAALYAIVASGAVLSAEWLRVATLDFEPATHQAGILVAAYLATALASLLMGQRAAASETLARQRGLDLANLAQLNEYVLQRLQAGVLVVDGDGTLRLTNRYARRLLHLPDGATEGLNLTTAAPHLAVRLKRWREYREHGEEPVRLHPQGPDLQVTFHPITPRGALVFLEDTGALTQQAQQMKLASLGRLTASIAHEIRNPLEAISHASQLLAESPSLDPEDQRLTEIALEQCVRLDNTVQNVLHLSRREPPQPRTFALTPWLRTFVRRYRETAALPEECLTVTVEPVDVVAWMDPAHLTQVLNGLCDNAVRHADTEGEPVRIDLQGGILADGRTYLDVRDNGPGLSPAAAAHVFEPFFTTHRQGTGLGLYIARELAEHNRAQLTHLATPKGGACFRLIFSDRRGATL